MDYRDHAEKSGVQASQVDLPSNPPTDKVCMLKILVAHVTESESTCDRNNDNVAIVVQTSIARAS